MLAGGWGAVDVQRQYHQRVVLGVEMMRDHGVQNQRVAEFEFFFVRLVALAITAMPVPSSTYTTLAVEWI